MAEDLIHLCTHEAFLKRLLIGTSGTLLYKSVGLENNTRGFHSHLCRVTRTHTWALANKDKLSYERQSPSPLRGHAGPG